VKPQATGATDNKGIIYYLSKNNGQVVPLPSVSAQGFAAVSLSAAKSTSDGSCVVALGFPRSKIKALRDAVGGYNGNTWDQLFPESYDYLVASNIAATGALIKASMTDAEAVKRVPDKYKSYNNAALNVFFNTYSASIVMGASGGNPLLYFFFKACTATPLSACMDAANAALNPFGDVLLGIRVNITPTKSALAFAHNAARGRRCRRLRVLPSMRCRCS
jgi:hypothetical protein